MSTKAVDYKIILKRDGQTQQQRMPQWLDPSLIQIDSRTKEDFFNYIKAISKEINFYDLEAASNGISIDGTWEEFFNLTPDEITNLAKQTSLPPHIALWNAFLELYEKPKELLNSLTGRHLEFYYGEVLKLKRNDASPDKAHVTFELKKNTTDTLLSAGTVLLAGKDTSKKDLHYKLTHDIVVNKSKIVELKSLYVSPLNKNVITYAPVANSLDGMGAGLDQSNPRWNAFGHSQLSPAQVGFCLASEILRMKEGERKITVKLTITNFAVSSPDSLLYTNLLNVSLTGDKGWIGPKTISPKISSLENKQSEITFSFNIKATEPPIVNYDPALHGKSFDTLFPVLQIFINNEKTDFAYKDLVALDVIDSTIEVEVTGIKGLKLENDFGSINEQKSFNPFGPAPETNANFYVGCEEVFSKRLKSFSLNIEWKNIPDTRLDNYFAAYDGPKSNDDFKVLATFQDGFNWQVKSESINLFNVANAQNDSKWSFSNSPATVKQQPVNLPNISVRSQRNTGLSVNQKVSHKLALLVPEFAALKSFYLVNERSYKTAVQGMINAHKDIRRGSLSLRLTNGFFFKQYPKKYTERILEASKKGETPILPNEPFSPEIQSITLDYTACTVKTNFAGTSFNNYIDEEIEFYHSGPFGQMREHAYIRNQYDFLNNLNVKLLPSYYHEGEFYIGMTGVSAGDSACILFQVAEGSANPDRPKADVKWSVLCDNYWQDLTNDDFIFDTTNHLLSSGIIKFVFPRQATTSNTIMPGGMLWLRAAITENSDAVCNLIDVQPNAAIVEFDNRSNDPSHFEAPLIAGTIAKLEREVATVKKVNQPYASFGATRNENDKTFYTRVSERLRHKERGVALWDYEKLILQHFPNVHKVKCINHASLNSYYQPGNVLVIVVPDLTNQNAIDRFKPAVDKNSLDEIQSFLMKHVSSWVHVHISNPVYEPIKISMAVKLRRGFEFNYYQKVIDQQLQEFLSPWTINKGKDIYFGGKITKSMLVKFVEGLEYVDFLTDLRIFQSVDNGLSFGNNIELAEVSSPASILVSHDHHEIFRV